MTPTIPNQVEDISLCCISSKDLTLYAYLSLPLSSLRVIIVVMQYLLLSTALENQWTRFRFEITFLSSNQIQPILKHNTGPAQFIWSPRQTFVRSVKSDPNLAWFSKMMTTKYKKKRRKRTCEGHHEGLESLISRLCPKLFHHLQLYSNAQQQVPNDLPCFHPWHAIFLSKVALQVHTCIMHICSVIIDVSCK